MTRDWREECRGELTSMIEAQFGGVSLRTAPPLVWKPFSTPDRTTHACPNAHGDRTGTGNPRMNLLAADESGQCPILEGILTFGPKSTRLSSPPTCPLQFPFSSPRAPPLFREPQTRVSLTPTTSLRLNPGRTPEGSSTCEGPVALVPPEPFGIPWQGGS